VLIGRRPARVANRAKQRQPPAVRRSPPGCYPLGRGGSDPDRNRRSIILWGLGLGRNEGPGCDRRGGHGNPAVEGGVL
jgi:hypothetical protein